MTSARWLLGCQDAVLAAATSLRMARQDPTHFAVQLARRAAPGWLRRREPRQRRASAWRALRWFLLDRPDRAAEDLRAVGRRGRLGAELASALGVAEPAELRGAPAARAWLARGELTRALDCLDQHDALSQRIESERRVYSAGVQLPVTSGTFSRHPDAGLRVLFVLTNSLPYTQSGYTVRTHAILSELVRQGVAVLAVTRIGYPVTVGRLGNPRSQIIDGVEYQRLPAWRLPVRLDDRLSAQVRALRPIVERFKPDVLHTTTDLTNALVTRALAQSYGLPWVYELRGQLELTWVAARPAQLQSAAEHSERVRLWRTRDAELAADADQVIVLSGVQRAEMISRGVDPAKILVLPNSVADEVFERPPSAPADARERLGLPRAGRWVGSVTSIVDYEGLDILLDAVAAARSQGHDLRVAVAGDGVARPDLLAQAALLGLDDQVAVFPGRVPAAEALAWYEALDAFVVPRLDTPVCRVVTPLKPLNALALGRPVLASELPALRSLGDWAPELVSWAPAADPDAWAAALVALTERFDQPTQSPTSVPSWAEVVTRLRTSYPSR